MILNRFSFSSLFIHIFFFIYVLFLLGSKKTKENDIKKLNIINTNLIGIIDQSKESKKTPEDLEEKNNIQNKEIVKIEDIIEEKKEEIIIPKKEEVKIKKEDIIAPKKEDLKIKKEDIITPKKEDLKIKKEDIITPKKEEVKIKKEEIKKPIKKNDEKKQPEKKKEIKKPIKASQNKKNPEKNNDKKIIENLKNQLTKSQEKIKEIENLNNENREDIIDMASLQTYIRTQIKSCWEIPNALFNEEKIYIIIQIRLNENGEVVNSKIINKDQYYHNEYFEKLKNSALSAIDRCSPILGLNKKDYSKWKEIELIFDPGKLYN